MRKLTEETKDITLNESKTFMRLPGHVIGNELYEANRMLDTIYSRLTNGNDYIDEDFRTLIKALQNIRWEAKRFNVGDEVPVSYKYKKK